MRKILSFILLIATICLISSCVESTPSVKQYTVTFKDYDGTILKEEIVQEGHSATAPNDPLRIGYIFIGWSEDYSNVYKNTICIAQYEKDSNITFEYKVTFVDYNGTILKEDIVEEGKSATAPQNPERSGYNFIGWDKDYTNVTKDMIIVALYEKIQDVEVTKYTVTFITNCETVIESQEIEKGNKVIEPTNPTKEGYTFLGWYENDEEWNFDKYALLSDITLVAKWEKDIYNITYFDDGAQKNENPTTYSIGDNIEFVQPVKEGYIFLGWYTDQTYNNEIKNLSLDTIGNIVLYAKWEIIKYEITYELNKGIFGYYVSREKMVEDFIKDYNSFNNKNQTVKTFRELELYTDVQLVINLLYDINYKDKWSWIINYLSTVTNNENKTAFKEFYNCNTLEELNNLNVDYKYIIAWEIRGFIGGIKYDKHSNPIYHSADYSQEEIANGFGRITDKDIRIKIIDEFLADCAAHLGKTVEEIKFDTAATWQSNWSWGAFFATNADNGKNPAYPSAEQPSFWNVPANREKWLWLIECIYDTMLSYPGGDTYTGTLAHIKNALDRNFCGSPQTIAYAIWYFLNGQTHGYFGYNFGYNDGYGVSISDIKLNENKKNPTYTIEDKIILNNPYKEGYVFIGWTSDTILEPTSNIVLENETGNKHFVAHYTPITYTITFNTNGGVAVDSIQYTIESDQIILPKTIKEEYAFIGWFDEFDNKIDKINKGTFGDIVLYAKWDNTVYTVTYDLNGGKGAEGNPTSYVLLDTPITLIEPTKEGYEFLGWYDENDKIIYELTGGNFKLTAKWAPDTYIIKYNLNGGCFNYDDNDLIDYYTSYDRNKMVQNLLADLMAWAGKTNKPTCMIDDSGDEYGFVNIFSAIYGFFSDVKYAEKWGWVKDYIIESTEGGSKDSLISGSEAFWRYSLGAFLFEDYRASWPKTADFTKIELANGFLKDFLIEENIYCYTISSLPFELLTPEKDGNLFIGWYDNATFTGEALTEISVDAREDLTLYAKWEENKYNIAYELNGGTLSENLVQIFKHNEVVTLPIPTKEGYEFLGWTYNGEYIEKIDNQNYTLEAQWGGMLKYELNSNKLSYCVIGLGTITDDHIVIPDKYNELPITNIGESAFEGCTSLESIEIPNSVTSIESYAFEGCTILESVYYNGTIEDWCKISLSDYSSNPMYYAKHLYMLNENKEYYDATDENNDVNLVIPNEVTSISDYQYYKMSALKTVVIPNSVTSIGSFAFSYCASLESIEITNSVTSIGSWTFYECTSLETIEIPNSVTSIENWAFSYCASLETIEIPNSVTSIGYYAFCDCTSLTTIEIPNSVTSIGYDAFLNCTSLESIEIPNSVTSIGKYAFYGCTSLESIVIGNSVTSIGSGAFRYCRSLTIYCEATSKPSGWDTDWNSSNCPVEWGFNGTFEYTINYILPGISGVKFTSSGKKYPTKQEYINGTVHVLETLDIPGYTFDGWYSNGVLITEITSDVLLVNPSLTFEAKYTINIYTLTFNSSIEGIESPEPIEYTVKDEVILPELKATGYKFLGWGYYSEGKFFQLDGLIIREGNCANVTLHAIWKIE